MMSQTSVHAQEKQDLYFNDVTSDNNTTYLSIPSNWYTDAEKTQQFTGSLDGTYNGNVTNTGQFNTKNQAHTAPTFYNLNYNVTEIDNSNLDFLVLGNDSNVITKNDFNLNLQFAPKDGKSQLTYKFKLWANSGKNDFSTAFGMIENSTSKLNIKMQASNAANGHQIMRFDSHDTYWCNAFEIHDANINNVTVEKGRLDIGMHSEMKGNNLSIASNEAIFSATSLSTGGDCGRVIFDTMDFSAGKIVFDINEVENDFIQINGGIAKNSADAKLTFEIGVDALTLKEWLNASELDEFVVDIMSFKTDESSFVAEDILLETQSEVIGSIEFKPNTSTGLTSVSLTLSVPEPATVAAILGVIAIGFAIYRRRR